MFDEEGLDGWSSGTSGQSIDNVTWLDSFEKSRGVIRLDGSDFGYPDGQPNSWVSRELELSWDATMLKFITSTHPRDNANAELRVRLVDENQVSHTLLDWELGIPGVEGEMFWMSREVDLSAFAGQMVTLFFEQGDNDIGVHEQRYIDNITIE